MSKLGGISRARAMATVFMLYAGTVFGFTGSPGGSGSGRSRRTSAAGGSGGWTPGKQRRGKTRGSVSRRKMKRGIAARAKQPVIVTDTLDYSLA